MQKQRKREALTVTRLINEVLVSQLSIPLSTTLLVEETLVGFS